MDQLHSFINIRVVAGLLVKKKTTLHIHLQKKLKKYNRRDK